MKQVVGGAAFAAAAFLMGCSGGGGDAAPQAPSPTVTLTASPSAILTGQSTTLAWTSANATSCTASGSWSGTGPLSGSQTFTIYSAGNYSFALTCSGPGGSSFAIANVTVASSGGGSGGGGSGTEFSVSLTGNPAQVAVGDSTTLTWSAPEASSCTASGAWSGTKTPAGSQSVTIDSVGYSYFYLSCTGPNGYGYAQAYVQGLQSTVSLAASASTVGAGQTATLTWTTTYASTCTASGAWSGTKAASGSEVVTVGTLGVHDYTLTCSDPGAAGSATASITGAAPAVTFRAFPSKVEVGDTVTLSWETQYANECAASQDWSGSYGIAGSKTLTVSSSGVKNYTLTCSNAGGSQAKSASATGVAVPALPPATAFQLNPRHDGYVNFSGGITLPLTATPTWSRNLGAEASYALIAEGLVFVVTRNTDSSYGNRLFALSQSTGNTVWGPIALPGVYYWNGFTYADGRIFTVNFDGLVRAFNASNGAALWSRQMPGYWHTAEPVAFGGLVYATGNGGTLAMDQVTGAIQWQRQVDGDLASPAVTSAGLYMIPNCGTEAFNPVTGAPLWKSTLCGSYGVDMAVRNGIAFARYTDGNMFWQDASTGADAGSLSSQRSMAMTDTRIVTLYSGTLTATDIATGLQKWSFAGDGGLVTAPVIVNDTVFVGATSGKVYAVSLATGAQQWFGSTAALGAPDQWNQSLVSGPAAGEGLLVMSGGSTVAAWKLK